MRGDIALSPADYFRLWRGMELAAGDREIALLFAEHFKAEAFDAPIFASLCSPNFNVAAKRLSFYKPLIHIRGGRGCRRERSECRPIDLGARQIDVDHCVRNLL